MWLTSLFLATLSDVTEALFATPADAVYKPFLAVSVDTFSKPCLATPVFKYSSSLSGTITTLLQSPSPAYVFWKVTISLNGEWSSVGGSVVLQSSIS
jgi:hypothetical protein